MHISSHRALDYIPPLVYAAIRIGSALPLLALSARLQVRTEGPQCSIVQSPPPPSPPPLPASPLAARATCPQTVNARCVSSAKCKPHIKNTKGSPSDSSHTPCARLPVLMQ